MLRSMQTNALSWGPYLTKTEIHWACSGLTLPGVRHTILCSILDHQKAMNCSHLLLLFYKFYTFTISSAQTSGSLVWFYLPGLVLNWAFEVSMKTNPYQMFSTGRNFFWRLCKWHFQCTRQMLKYDGAVHLVGISGSFLFNDSAPHFPKNVENRLGYVRLG